MDYLPLFHDLESAPCLVVGGGELARRKLELLKRAGAECTVVAPDISAEVTTLADVLVHRPFQAGDVARQRLVIAATNDTVVNSRVAEAARDAAVPVNVVDDAKLSNVIFPAIVDRNPVVVAVSTGGASPTLARHLRARLEVFLPQSLGALGQRLSAMRSEFAARGEKPGRAFWEAVIEGRQVEQTAPEEAAPPRTGWVGIVGAGPGDPELLTIKALQLLQRADLVLYDNLVNRATLEYARRDAEKRYVGKKRAFKGTRQEDIHQQMVDAAQAGQNVVRLKGGDPFVFGRGGEEIQTLTEEGIECVVVPGITAALGAASYAGVPLTYRNLSQSVRFLTGHRARGSIDLDWADLAKPAQTLVLYMGLFNLGEISDQLIRHGMAADTPAVLVERATLPEQRVVEGTVGTLERAAVEARVEGPTSVIIGEVVRHRTRVTNSLSV